MDVTLAQSPDAKLALKLVRDLQSHFQEQLINSGGSGQFASVVWKRDEGKHGGGERRTYGGGTDYNRASLNVSQVHYDDLPTRPLESATALSCIVHPAHPLEPSLHLHI